LGRDFYASPRLSPDGQTLAWLAWDLPDMPWEAAALYVASVYEDGSVGPSQLVAGGFGASVFQPEWSFAGDLYYISDASGWGNLYKWDGQTTDAVASMEADCGRPQWVFGVRSYALSESGEIAISAIQDGQSALKIVGDEGHVQTLDLDLTSVENIAPLRSPDGFGYAAIVTTDQNPAAIAFIDGVGADVDIIRRSADVSLDAGDISCARVIAFHGDEGDIVYGQYYPPANKSCAAPGGRVTACHSGYSWWTVGDGKSWFSMEGSILDQPRLWLF